MVTFASATKPSSTIPTRAPAQRRVGHSVAISCSVPNDLCELYNDDCRSLTQLVSPSRDPVGYQSSGNSYAYCGSGPSSKLDPSGNIEYRHDKTYFGTGNDCGKFSAKGYFVFSRPGDLPISSAGWIVQHIRTSFIQQGCCNNSEKFFASAPCARGGFTTRPGEEGVYEYWEASRIDSADTSSRTDTWGYPKGILFTPSSGSYEQSGEAWVFGPDDLPNEDMFKEDPQSGSGRFTCENPLKGIMSISQLASLSRGIKRKWAFSWNCCGKGTEEFLGPEIDEHTPLK